MSSNRIARTQSFGQRATPEAKSAAQEWPTSEANQQEQHQPPTHTHTMADAALMAPFRPLDPSGGQARRDTALERVPGTICGGVLRDYRRRLPMYWSDIKAGMTLKTVSAALFMFWATFLR